MTYVMEKLTITVGLVVQYEWMGFYSNVKKNTCNNCRFNLFKYMYWMSLTSLLGKRKDFFFWKYELIKLYDVPVCDTFFKMKVG